MFFFSGDSGHPSLHSFPTRRSSDLETIVAQAKLRGVDPLLFAGLMRQESAFNPTARSSANALGLAQVIPSTGQGIRSEEHTSELQSQSNLVCRLLLEKKNNKICLNC